METMGSAGPEPAAQTTAGDVRAERAGGIQPAWAAYVAADYEFSDFAPGARVLDIGFGNGTQMRRTQRAGATAFGIEYDAALAHKGRRAGLHVCQALAEQLPIRTGAVDGVICKVVIPLTDESRTVQEIARVLRPGGTAHLVSHGLGYSLRYVLAPGGLLLRVYGLRTILNTWFYRITGRRLPGFLGDTLYQTAPALRRYYAHAGLVLAWVHPTPRFLGLPVFIYHRLQRQGEPAGIR